MEVSDIEDSSEALRNDSEWSFICLTTRNEEQCAAYREELRWLWKCGALKAKRFLVVADPSENLGSGGSSLNGLLNTVERLCVLHGLTVLSEEVLEHNKILIINCGRDFPLNKCGSAFLYLGTDLVTETNFRVPFNVFLHQIVELNRLAANFGNGVWITGGDAFWKIGQLSIPDSMKRITDSLLAFTFKADSSLAKTSGVYCLNDDMRISGIDYRTDKYENAPDVPLVLTLLYMPFRVAEIFLSLYAIHPLSSCTYYGIDNGSPSLQLSIFFDFVLAAADKMEKDNYVYHCSNSSLEQPNSIVVKAREVLYETFSSITAYAVFLDVVKYHYFQPPSIENVARFWKLWNERESTNLAEITSQMYLPGLKNSSHFEAPMHKCFLSNRTEMLDRWFTIIGDVIRQNKAQCIQSYLKSVCIASGLTPTFALIRYLHKLCLEDKGNSCADRALFYVAEILALCAQRRGGLRSGPAGNVAFAGYIRNIQEGDVAKGLIAMRNELVNWMDTPQRLIRAARHYEAAAQVFVQKNVMKFCLRQLPYIRDGCGLDCGVSVTSACRVDIAGGWTDTPPITMQLDYSAVVNIAVMVDEKKPVGCEIWPSYSQNGISLKDLGIRLLTIKEIRDLSNKPSLPGSLVCAVLLAAQFIKETDKSLEASFGRTFSNGIKGLEITTSSSLPHGSGLGISSILAAALVSALWTIMGIKFDVDGVCHAVLLAEQYLTTGGGWQDQVGGIVPGIKISRFSKSEQKVTIEKIFCEEAFISIINQRLILIYTGQTRLAKNLLQQVVRSWYVKEEGLLNVLKSLAITAENSANLLAEGHFPVEEAKQYYADKKAIAPTCEPTFVKDLIEDLSKNSLIDCAWLAGAGGGGFLIVWLTEGRNLDDLKNYLLTNRVYHGLSAHSVVVDMKPLEIALH